MFIQHALMASYDDTRYYLEQQQHNYCTIIYFVVAKKRTIAPFFGMLHRDEARKPSNGAIYWKSVKALCGYMMMRTFPLSWETIQALGYSKIIRKRGHR